MDIQSRLLEGQFFKFEDTDEDSFTYSEGVLVNYIEGSPTGSELTVPSLTEESLVVEWPDGSSTTFGVNQLTWIE